uniref:Uncharacterized protein n=1 Tax=Ciona intestinalis TaxID=7719 RepID=H2XV54_CIOIN
MKANTTTQESRDDVFSSSESCNVDVVECGAFVLIGHDYIYACLKQLVPVIIKEAVKPHFNLQYAYITALRQLPL